MHNANDHEKNQVNVPEDGKPRPSEVVLSLFPGTIATYVQGKQEEDAIGLWYWALLAALFLALGWLAWTQEVEERCLHTNFLTGSSVPVSQS